MEQYAVGEIIKEYRLRLGITQEDLCDEGVSPVTISRIESGNELPTLRVLKSMFAKMGFPLPINIAPVSDEEYDFFLLGEKIKKMVAKKDFSYENDLERYHQKKSPDVFSEQFYLYHKALLVRYKNGNSVEALQTFILSLQKTIPDFDIHNELSGEHFITSMEINILQEIAHILIHTEKSLGKKWLFFLLDYVQNGKINFNEYRDCFFRTALSAMRFLADEKDALSLKELSASALKLCKGGLCLFDFPKILFFKGCAHTWLSEKEDAIVCLTSAYSLFESLDKKSEAKKIAHFIKDNGLTSTLPSETIFQCHLP